MTGLVLPLNDRRDLTGLFVGATVIIMSIPGHKDGPALVTRVHAQGHTATNAQGQPVEWTGKRPMIDVVFVCAVEDDPNDWQINEVHNLPHYWDVETRLLIEGKRAQTMSACPRYAVVQNMEGH